MQQQPVAVLFERCLHWNFLHETTGHEPLKFNPFLVDNRDRYPAP